MKRTTCPAIFFVLFASATASSAENWPQFRGPGALGVSDNPDLPDTWSRTKNVLWKKAVPGRGWSSPVVWGQRVFVTSVINDGTSEEPKKGLYFGGNRLKPPVTVHHWKVYCLHLDTGKVLWERLAHQGKPAVSRHIKNSYASETPVTDGKHIYVYFGNLGLFCYTLEGELVWSKEFPARRTRFGWGTAASPVLHKDRLYLVNDNDEQSYLLALDKATGEEIWRTKRDEKSNWATPYVWQNKLRTEIITPGTGKVRSYDLEGKLLYEFGGCSSITIATPYSKFGLLYVSSGYILDGKRPVFAIRPGAKGDISLSEPESGNQYIAWCQKQAAPYNPSTLVYGDLLYVLHDRGFLACYDAKTGEEVYGKQRLPGGRSFTASPWAAGGKIFCANEYGATFVVQAGRKFKLLHTNKLSDDDMCMATPALAGDRLILRTTEMLYCFQNKAGDSAKDSSESPKSTPSKPDAKESTQSTPAPGIQKRTYHFKEADKEMEYALFAPSAYKKDRKHPLIVALHGYGSTPGQIIRYPGLVRLAEKHGYIVAAPMGYNRRGWYGSRGKGGGRRGDPENLGELSEKDVMNVLGIVRKEFNIDDRRIYLMGHSMGGGGTWHLGIKHPDLWAALAPIAPAIRGRLDELEKIKHVPVIVVQGDNDRLVPVSGARRWVARMKELEMTHVYIEVAGGGHVRVAFDNIPRIFDFFNEHQR